MQITTTIVPPQIIQHFNRLLLIVHDRRKRCLEEIEECRAKAQAKYKAGGRKMREFEELLGIFKELYEWQKAQETYNKAEVKETMERPVIPIQAINRLRGELGKNVRDAFKLANRNK
jgi:hypothetical protein